MNIQEIYSLLGKYYDGTSTDEEEIRLRQFFLEDEVPAELEEDRQIFLHWNGETSIPMPDEGFEQRILKRIDAAEHGNRFRMRRILFPAMSSAAAILILFGSWFFFIHRQEPGDTFKDPALAYNESVKILYSVSSRLNTGMNALEPVRKARSVTAKSLGTFEKSTAIINDNFKSLDYFRKTMQIVSSPLDLNAVKKQVR